MKLSKAGVELLTRFEGCILYPYDDHDTVWPRRRIRKGEAIKGYPTIGIGHVIREGEDLWRELTREDAADLLRRDIVDYEAAVCRNVTAPLNQHQFDALVSFTYNVGPGGFAGSSLRKAVNEQRWDDCPALFALWNKSKGKVLSGLSMRRAQEAALFMTPVPEDDSIDTAQVMASVYETASKMVGELVSRDMARESEAPPDTERNT